MNLSAPHFGSYHGDSRRDNDSTASSSYPFVAPTPVNLGKSYTANTLTPGMIPSPLNFPSITPPSSPYSLYGLYSPTAGPQTSRLSPLCDPTYLRRLKNNPMFRDLQSLLLQECMQMQVPANLITTSWNLMKLNKDTPTANTATNQHPLSSLAPPTSSSSNLNSTNQSTSSQNSGQQVYIQHMKLQDKLLKVRIDPAISADGLSVENDYSKEVGNIEMDRYRALNSCPSDEVKVTINSYYDKQRMKLIEATEDSLNKLITKAENLRNAVMKNHGSETTSLPKRTPQQATQPLAHIPTEAQGASLLLQPLEDKDKINAVRKLKFNACDDNEDAEDDYLNGSVNSEDFEIDEIDVETVDKKEENCNSNDLNNLTCNTDILKQCLVESGLDTIPVDSRVGMSADSELQRRNDASVVSNTSVVTNDSILPDSTSSAASDSPISMASAEDLTNQNLSIDGSTSGVNNSTFSSEEQHISPIRTGESSSKSRQFLPQSNFNFGTQLFSTPTPNSDLRFTSPDALNMALSEIQSLCGGPTVNFTPELRRDFNLPSYTPEVVKSSPLSDVSSASNSGIPGSYNHGTVFPYSMPATVTTDAYHQQQRTPNDNSFYQHGSQFARLPSEKNHHTSTTSQQNCHQQRQQQQQHKQQQLQRLLPQQQSQSSDTKNNNIQLNNKLTTRSTANTTHKEAISTATKDDKVTTSTASSGVDNSQSDNFNFENTPVFRTHRMLTPEATDILSRWYSEHVQYPYPNDEEVDHLSKLTGITARQVKKWMANKRVRCFNTLSITGNQHPIKYKYKGQGRKRKAPCMEKENCDSTSSADKKPNYTMLTEEAKTVLNRWYEDHLHNPYPSEEEKQLLATQCKISAAQVKSWFANKRNRTNNTKRQVPNYFIDKFPEYSQLVHMVGQKREEERLLKRRKVNEVMYIQPPFYL